MSRGGRFRAADLAALADRGVRGEVLDGRLVLAPPPARHHERAVRNLAARLRMALPEGTLVRSRAPVHLPDGDGPVPDLAVTGAPPDAADLPPAAVHTAVEVVGADGRFLDRVYKPDRYADAGIPCLWRVELAAWPGYRGLLPIVVVRLRQPGGWSETVATAGRVHQLPVAYRREPGGAAVPVPVRLDPRVLAGRSAADW